MNTIAAILKMTPKKYNLMVFDFYVFWCELNSDNKVELQVMLSNQQLYNWFMLQFEMLELAFYDKAASVNSMVALDKIYMESTIVVGEYYPPRHLLKKIKKTGLQNASNTINTNLN